MSILTFEEFKAIMDSIEEEVRFQDKIYFAVKSLNGEYFRNTPAVYSTIILLDKIFEDDSECPLIDYWVYELDFGKDWKEGCVTEGDNDIKLETVSDLYDELIRQRALKEAM